MGTPGCHHLSDGRRNRVSRHVESICRIGRARLAQEHQTTAHGFCAGGRLRAGGKGFYQGAAFCDFWTDAHTIASGLRVPKSFADHLILQDIYESNGTAIAVSDQSILQSQKQLAELEGIFAAPEGAATLAALKELLQQGWVHPEEKIVLFNTGSGLKYLDHKN